MKREWYGHDAPDVTLESWKENHTFAFKSEEIYVWNTFRNIDKLTIICSETPFSRNFYYTETNHMIFNAKR